MKTHKRAIRAAECPDRNESEKTKIPLSASIDNECAGRNIKSNRKRTLLAIIITMLIFIAVTRLLSLSHGLRLHPDELVFFSSASSLFLNSPYHAFKAYPEGAFFMQMPFQMVRQFALLLIHFGGNTQISGAHLTGRLASVFYFSLGAVLGCTFLNIIQKKKLPILLYAITIVFSLFQIEQSRYATGEAPSFFLMMAMLNLLALSLRSNKTSLLLAAAFVAGALGGVKYPQIYFILLPIGAAFMIQRSAKKTLIFHILLILACSTAGFICLSPSVLKPGFLWDAVFRETGAYLDHPNIVAAGTPLGHLTSLSLFHFLYADVPFAPIFAIAGMVFLFKNNERSNFRTFFSLIVPIVLLGFFIYNLFIQALYFRTYYIYFCVCMIYAAIGMSELFARKRIKQLILALLCIMIVRGGFFTYLLSQPQKDAVAPLYTHEKWSDRAAVTVTGTGFTEGDIPGQATQISMYDAFLSLTPSLNAGEFQMIGGYQFGIARNRIFEMKNADVISATNGWDSFREENDPYLFYKLYPDYYYDLFGFWLEGNMETYYEFPSVYYYYKPSAD